MLHIMPLKIMFFAVWLCIFWAFLAMIVYQPFAFGHAFHQAHDLAFYSYIGLRLIHACIIKSQVPHEVENSTYTSQDDLTNNDMDRCKISKWEVALCAPDRVHMHCLTEIIRCKYKTCCDIICAQSK